MGEQEELYYKDKPTAKEKKKMCILASNFKFACLSSCQPQLNARLLQATYIMKHSCHMTLSTICIIPTLDANVSLMVHDLLKDLSFIYTAN